MKKQDKGFEPAFMKLAATHHRLVGTAGLGTLVEAFHRSELAKPFAAALPKRSSYRSRGSYCLGLTQVASFLAGHDCLDDLEEFRSDPSLERLFKGETAAPRTMGDFLRDFGPENFERFNRFLATQAKRYRERLNGRAKKELKPSLAPRWNIDSTSHVQHGVKMEGVAWNYKNEWCLDSQVIFDELGMGWDMELRPGNSKSGTGAGEQIRRVAASYKFEDEKYVSGDSAFCWEEPITASLGVGAKFTFTANQATTGWEDHIEEITKWEPWAFPEKQAKAAAEAEIELPQVELGRFLWQPSWNKTFAFQSSSRGPKSKADRRKANGNATASSPILICRSARSRA